MSSSRSASPSSLERYPLEDMHIHDHGTNSSTLAAPGFQLTVSASSSSEHLDMQPGRPRAMSRCSCAVSEHSVDSRENVGGILLNNNPVGTFSSNKALNRRKSRRMTRNSAMSVRELEDDADSRISVREQTEEDVCFPMMTSTDNSGINFSALDGYTDQQLDEEENCQKCAEHPLTGHRPLAPQAIGAGAVLSTPDSVPSSQQTKIGDLPPKSPSILPMYKDASIPPVWGRRNSMFQDRFSFFSANKEETIHAPDLPSLVDEDQSFSELFDESKGTWWLDCLDPTDSEMRAITKAFSLHPLTAEDIRTEESREKVELFNSYYFICFHTFEADVDSEDYLEPINVYIVVFRSGILSFHFSPIAHCANVRRRIRQLRDYVNVSADWMCYALIDDITDSFAPIIREIEVEADVIEDSVLVARETDFGYILRRIGEARKQVMTMLRLLSGKADVIKMFAKRCNKHWDNAPRGEIGLYLGDIQDHIITMHQNLSAYEKIFSRSHSNYLAQLQVESFHSNNTITKVLGRATIIGTILVPLNLIPGLFGMNVHVPGEPGDVQGSFGWFFGIASIIITVAIVLGYIGNRWLTRLETSRPDSSSRSARSSASIISRHRQRAPSPVSALYA
jgi:magnesium transporter